MMAPMTESGLTAWDGRGLPPAAAARLAHAQTSRVAGSLLSVPDAAALASTGFSPVGEVMGCVVQHTGWSGWGGCGLYVGARAGKPKVLLAEGSRYAGLGPYVRALYNAWDLTMSRMLAEASALGADGVVGVSVTEKFLETENRELLALGTAVRGNCRARAQHPFATDLSGADTSKLLHAGWAPAGIVFGIAVGTRHDDSQALRGSQMWSGNNEITAYTELVNEVRAHARRQLVKRGRSLRGEAVIVSDMSLRVRETPCSVGQDHTAESRVHGTVATRFRSRSSPATSTLTMLSLRDRHELPR